MSDKRVFSLNVVGRAAMTDAPRIYAALVWVMASTLAGTGIVPYQAFNASAVV